MILHFHHDKERVNSSSLAVISEPIKLQQFKLNSHPDAKTRMSPIELTREFVSCRLLKRCEDGCKMDIYDIMICALQQQQQQLDNNNSRDCLDLNKPNKHNASKLMSLNVAIDSTS